MSINKYNIRGLLNITDKNITFKDNFFFKKKIHHVNTNIISAKLTYTPDRCPMCGCSSNVVKIIKNGFKVSSIKLQSIVGNPTVLKLKKQRFLCKDCNSSFMAQTDIVDKYCSISKDVKRAISASLISVSSFKDISNRFNVSSILLLEFLDLLVILMFLGLSLFLCVFPWMSLSLLGMWILL